MTENRDCDLTNDNEATDPETGTMSITETEYREDEIEVSIEKFDGSEEFQSEPIPSSEVGGSIVDRFMHSPYRNRAIISIILLIFAFVLIFPIADFASNPETYTSTIETLDEKKNNVLGLTVTAIGSAAAISAIPGDAGAPIANAIMNLNSNLLIVLAVIYLEKFLVTTLGLVGCRILLPAALACFIIALMSLKSQRIQTIASQIGKKVLVIGLALTFVIPISVFVTDLIDNTYEANIEASNAAASQASAELESAVEETAESTEEEGEGGGGILEFFSGVKDAVVNTVVNATTNALSTLQNALTSLIDTVAIMIVTSCIIPILVLVVFLWLLNAIIGVKIDMPLKKRNTEFFKEKSKTERTRKAA